MNVGCLVGDGLRDDIGDEAHDGGIFVHVGFVFLDGFGGDVALIAVLKAAGADTAVLKDELVDFFREAEMPDERPRGEGAYPVGHVGIGRPGAGEVQWEVVE